MVECVEKIHAKLQLGLLCDLRVLVERDVSIVDTRSVDQVPACVTDRAKRLSPQSGWIKVIVPAMLDPESIRQVLHSAGIGENLGWGDDVRTVKAPKEADHRR